MQFTLTMPKLSPTMTEGVIVKWHKAIGEYVEANQLLLEIATDKATVEYNALDSGWLRKIMIANGEDARINQPIAIMTEAKDDIVNESDVVDQTQPVAKQDTEKCVLNEEVIKSDQKDNLNRNFHLEKPINEAIKLFQGLFVPEPPLTNYQFPHAKQFSDRVKASPLAKRLAREKNLDLSTIKGSGPGGRIVSQDLNGKAIGKVSIFNSSRQPIIYPGTYEEERLSPTHKVVGKRLQEAKSFIPHFYVLMKINPQALIDLREQLNRQDVFFTFNDFIIKASALALQKHPEINSGFNSVNQTVIRFKTIDVSVAVGLATGLITPIIRHANYKDLNTISVEIKDLVQRAKEGKLAQEEYKGGSFTVSNLGMYGVSEFIAIINPPQAAILAVGGMLPVTLFSKGMVMQGMEMNVTLSGDHRVIDGVDAAKFLVTFKDIIENPAILLT